MKIVMLFGTFDILHIGHINLFQQAKKKGDKLVVVVARDINVKKNKNKKPLFCETERLEVLKNIRLIDEVLLGDKNNPYKIIKITKPNIIALGYDQNAYVDDLKKFLKDNNLSTKILRLKPYKQNKYKSHKIREQIEKQL